MGITNIVADQTMTASPAIQVYNPQAGNALPLLADTSRGDIAVTLGPANAATLTSGDYVLLFSNKPVDAEDPQKHAGEVKQVTAIDVLTGLITFDDQIFDTYRVADSAATARVTVLRNITLSDFSVTSVAPFYTANAGFTFFRFVENLQIERVEATPCICKWRSIAVGCPRLGGDQGFESFSLQRGVWCEPDFRG